MNKNIPGLRYTDMPLERNSVLRADADWIGRQLTSGEGLFLVYSKNNNLVDYPVPDARPDAQPNVIWISVDKIPEALRSVSNVVYLGHRKGAGDDTCDRTPVFAIDLSDADPVSVDTFQQSLGPHTNFVDLRRIGPLLNADEAAIMAYGRGLCFWHRQNRFCGVCGHATRPARGGHVIQCQNTACKKEIYPRIDPAVIMLVESVDPDSNKPVCLLGRHKGLPTGVYSTLAGYIDPGESMEEAVAREVMEESGIRIHAATYVASQPWAFPSSMMIGFRAQADYDQITVAEDELEDARWFTLEEVQGFAEPNSGASQISFPRKDSIARSLIELWLRDNA